MTSPGPAFAAIVGQMGAPATRRFLQSGFRPDDAMSVSRTLVETVDLNRIVAFGQDDATVIQLQLRLVQGWDLWHDGHHTAAAPWAAMESVFQDMRPDSRVRLPDPVDTVNFRLPYVALGRLARDLGVPRVRDLNVRPAVGVNDAVLGHLGLALLPALNEPERASLLFVEHVMQALCAHVAERYGGMNLRHPKRRGGLASWQERRATEMINERLSGDVSIGRLAEECGLSATHFTRAFRQSIGTSPHRWLQERRIDKAKQLLRAKAMSLPEIALACGFADQSHFTRVFSARVGVAPGTWRRLCAGN